MLAVSTRGLLALLLPFGAADPEGRTLTGHDGWVGAVAFSPDGKRLAAGGWDKTVRLWNLTEVLPEKKAKE